MRILHLDSGPTMRGGQWQVLYLLRGLRERGGSALLLARGELLERALHERFAAAPLSLAGLLRARGKADLIHAHDARSHSMAVLPGMATVPLVVSRRVAFPVKTGAASRWKYARATHFIAISHFVAARLEQAGISPQAVTVVHDGVPLAKEHARAEHGHVVSPATDDPMKGAALVREAGRLAGVPIHFSDNLAEDLSHASMFVYLTRSEGLGSAALLAMGRGIPVIASRVEGLHEVVDDGRTGILVENSPESVASAIQRLKADPDLANRMGAAGRQRAEEYFSVDRMVAETIRVYEKIQR